MATELKGLRKLPAGFERYTHPVQYVNVAKNGVGYRSTPAIWDRWDDVLGPKPSECIDALGSDHNWLATLVNGDLKFLPLLHPSTSVPLFRRNGDAKDGTPAPTNTKALAPAETFPPLPVKTLPLLPTGEEFPAPPDIDAAPPSSVSEMTVSVDHTGESKPKVEGVDTSTPASAELATSSKEDIYSEKVTSLGQ